MESIVHRPRNESARARAHTHTHTHTHKQTNKQTNKQTHQLEEIRKKTIALEKENWNVEYTWIKEHAGNYGKELANRLAKEAARNNDICYKRIQKSEIEH